MTRKEGEMIADLLLQYGGWAGWLFIISQAQQAIRNVRIRQYGSGNRQLWWMFLVAHAVFGPHLLLAGAVMGGVSQVAGLVLDIVLLTQSYTMEWEKSDA